MADPVSLSAAAIAILALAKTLEKMTKNLTLDNSLQSY